MPTTFDGPTATGEQMAGYRVALFIVVFVAAGVGLSVWLFRRRPARPLGSLVMVAVASVLIAVGYWLGIGLAFMYLDVATGVTAPLWAQLAVGALFGIALAAAAFGVVTLLLAIRTAIIARRAGGHPSRIRLSNKRIEPMLRADTLSPVESESGSCATRSKGGGGPVTRPLDDSLDQPLSADDGDDVASTRRHSMGLVSGLPAPAARDLRRGDR